MRLIAGETFGRYRIAAEIGRGGQAIVYRAEQLDLERQVALKVFDEGYITRPGAFERFRREAIAAGRLEHPNIVAVYDAGEVEGRAYIAMRLIGGEPLARRLARLGPLDPARTLSMLGDIASALDFAHARGAVHRDVTPGNILLDEGGAAYLSDFGLVRMDDMPGVTRRGDWLGTAEYVSPEQVEGQPAQAASDRYALGVVAFEALTGRAPFVHREPSAILLAHVRAGLPSAHGLRPSLPIAVDAALERALAKDPTHRPVDCRALVADLERALGGTTVAGRGHPTAPVPVPAAPVSAAAAPAPPGDPWAVALARFRRPDGGADDPASRAAATATTAMALDGPGRPDDEPVRPVDQRTTQAFGGGTVGRRVSVGRDVAMALGIAAALLIGGATVGGWLMGAARADADSARSNGYAEGRAAGMDRGFERGRVQGVREGRKAGRAQGLKEGRASGLKQGRTQGREAGHAAGVEEGYDQGFASGQQEGRAAGAAEGRAGALGGLSPGGWYVVFVGSDTIGPAIGSSQPVSTDVGQCYSVSGGTVFSSPCAGGGGDSADTPRP